MAVQHHTKVQNRVSELDAVTIRSFRSTIRGEVIEPSDAAYDEARKVYNGMIDKRPRIIARCVDTADVVTCVLFAKEHDLELAVRGGGHNVAGFSVCDDGLVIDLSLMKGTRVDPATQTVWAQGGCTFGDVDHATHPYGLAVPGGIISTTGVGGLSLGGGIGHLTRKYGLTCDNILSADVVTADGRILTCNAHENEDLYWGLRGGGGNFGVVTSFQFKAHPVKTVLGGPIFYPIEKTGDVLRFFRDFIKTAPPELNAFFAFQIGPEAPFIPKQLQGVTMCALVLCYCGPVDQGEKVIAPIRSFSPPALDLVGPLPFPALQSLFDPLLPPGLQHYWKADYVNEITDAMIDIHVRYGPKVPTVQSTMHIYPVNGAPQKLGSGETAYAFRKANFVHVIPAMYTNPEDTQKNMAWVREYWNALRPHSAGGAYVNFLMEEGDERVVATYGANYSRLVELKDKYDPTNLFHHNQNIKPSDYDSVG